jgi:hypothetical protein
MTVLALTNKKYAQEWVCESCIIEPIASVAQSIFIHDLVTQRLLVVCHKNRRLQPEDDIAARVSGFRLVPAKSAEL